MIKWAIHHTPSGGYLPEVGPRMGYTGTEPLSMGEGSAFAPRLFASEAAAKRALTWWLKGITSVHRSRGDYYDETWSGWVPVSDKYITYVERRRDDMEVVRLKLEVVK